MDKALNHLLHAIASGKEYPTAHTDTCEKFKLNAEDGSKLQDGFDNWSDKRLDKLKNF